MSNPFGVRHPVSKLSAEGKRRTHEGAGAAGGALAGAGVHRGGSAAAVFANRFKYRKGGMGDLMSGRKDTRPEGQQPKRAAKVKTLLEQRHKLTNQQQKAMKAHKKTWGIPSTGFDPNIPSKTYIGYNRTLPTSIPGNRVPKTIAYVGAGKTGIAVRGAMVAGGAAAGAGIMAHRAKVKKGLPSTLKLAMREGSMERIPRTRVAENTHRAHLPDEDSRTAAAVRSSMKPARKADRGGSYALARLESNWHGQEAGKAIASGERRRGTQVGQHMHMGRAWKAEERKSLGKSVEFGKRDERW